MRQIPPGAIVVYAAQHTAEKPEKTSSITLTTILTNQEVRPSTLGGVPPFRQNSLLVGTRMDKFRQGHWASRAKLPRTAKEMKSHLIFYHVLLLQPKACKKPMIPADGRRHAMAVDMLNHLILFLDSAVDKAQDEQCHYSPGAFFFTQGDIVLREQIKVVGDAMWEQTTEHCHAFSAITMQLLHDLGGIFRRWILIPPTELRKPRQQ
jgi:hypothetical protein